MKKEILVVILVFFTAVGYFLLVENKTESTELLYETHVVELADITYNLLVADTDVKRIRGLSYRERLPEGVDGMLFIFPNKDYHGIWMKDMSMNLDILWYDENWQEVHAVYNVHPDTYPEVFTPPQQARYVIELPSK